MADPVKAEKQRRPYQKPAYEREDVFETMALGCGKATGEGAETAACAKKGSPNVS